MAVVLQLGHRIYHKTRVQSLKMVLHQAKGRLLTLGGTLTVIH